MKKYILPLSLALTASVAVTGQSKLDGNAKALINYYNNVQANPDATLAQPLYVPFEINTKSRAATVANVYVTLADGVTADDIKAEGFEILAKAGNMVIAQGTIDDITALGETDLVKNIAFGTKANAFLKNARVATGVDDIHNGTGLSRAYTGKGVICGIFDIGIDPNHPNFKTRDQKESRVKQLWYFPSSNGSFSQYSTAEEIAAFQTDANTDSHGTHTLGCMAGAFNEKTSSDAAYVDLDANGDVVAHARKSSGNNPYYGMAYDAELAVSCGSLYNDNTTISVSNMVDYAKKQGKPIVISLSFGTGPGSHDEYDSFAQFIDNLGKDAIICIAAGNDGDSNISFRKTFTSTDTQLKTFVDLSSSTASALMSIYSKDSTPFSIYPVIYDTKDKKFIMDDVAISNVGETTITTKEYSDGVHYGAFNTAFGSSYFRVVIDKNENTSNRFGASVSYSLTYNSATNSDGRYRLGIIVSGSADQTIEVTHQSDTSELVSNGLDGWETANPDFSICSSSCGKNVIIVGSYNASNPKVPCISSIQANGCAGSYLTFGGYPQGEVASYSSYGELSDGRTLPTVCAPGTGVISSVNSYETGYGTYFNSTYVTSAYYTLNGKKYYWAQMSGTSMATPIVAGGIATWLEAYPELTVDEAIATIQETAINDEYTAKGNKVQWGAGKFNAIGGLKKLLGSSGVANISANQDNIIVSDKGGNVFEAFVSGASNVNAQVYNISGQLVATANAAGEQVEVNASNLNHGIYILRVNGSYSQRIVVK
jgi:subtilisin family serine protease